MTTEYDELLGNSNYIPDLCSIMYKNLKFGDIEDTDRCYNVEKLINRYYPIYNQKCCLDSYNNLNNQCYTCDVIKIYN